MRTQTAVDAVFVFGMGWDGTETTGDAVFVFGMGSINPALRTGLGT